MENIKIGTLNVNKKINKNIENILRYMKSWKLDILFLQETNNISKKTKIKLDTNFNGTYHIHSNNKHTNEAGVITLITKMPDMEVIEETNITHDGRLQKIRIKILDTIINLFNIYAPLTKKDREQLFLKIIPHITQETTIMAGDFNFVENKELDISRGLNRVQPYKSIGSPTLDIIKNTTNIEDAWRNINPSKREFSRTDVRGTRTRLDRIYIQRNQLSHYQKGSYNIIPFSDHYLHQITLSTDSIYPTKILKGPGIWKINNSLLKDENTQDIIKHFWNIWKERKSEFNDPLVWWDNGKEEIKKILTKIGKKQNKIQNEEETSLIQKLKRITTEFTGQRDKWEEMQNIKRKINNINEHKMEGIKIRSRERNYENWEKNTSFFYNKLKINQQKQTFTSILDTSGNEKEGEEMIKEIKSFYENLYRPEISGNNSEEYLGNISNIPKLTETNRNKCEGFISISEAKKALSDMQNNKTPGSDGLGKEFYMTFWDTIGNDLVDTLNNCLLHQEMSPSMKTAIISLIFKKGDKKDIKNWRPISLLNYDYKILTKTMAARLKGVINEIIHVNQACGIKGRNIQDHLLLIYYLEKYINNPNQKRKGGYIMCLDQEKAFDRMEHSFIFHALRAFSFGDMFIDWVKTLYKDIKSKININGIITDYFNIGRGVRQGCPLSMLLFVIGIEILLIKIRNNNKLKGFKLTDGNILKIMAYADDVNFWINNTNELTEIYRLYTEYEQVSGAKLNKHKTEILNIGTIYKEKLSGEWEKYTKNGIKILGIYFANENMVKENYDRKLEKIKNEIRHLKNRNLTFFGKANVINTMLISKLQYVTKIIPISQHYITKIEREIFTYLWGTYNLEIIARKTAQLPSEKGGLDITSLQILNNASKLSHFTDYRKEGYAPWKALYSYFHGISLRDKIQYNQSESHTVITSHEIRENIGQINNMWNDIKKIDANKIKLKDLTKILKTKEKHISSIQCKYPLLKWNDIFKQNGRNSIIPNYIQEINYKIMHNVIYTKMFYINKFGQHHIRDRKCRLCNTGHEDLEHILIKCPQIQGLKQYITTLVTNKTLLSLQIWIKEPAKNIEDYIYLSYYRLIAITNWTEQEKLETYQLIYKYTYELQKFMNILKKLHPDKNISELGLNF